MSKLFVVATPIGNLGDISKRAIDTLKGVDLILAEDTRVTIKLLNHYEIKVPIISYHQHSKLNKVNNIIEQLEQGKDIALVSDAGTPGISDPGGKLIEQVVAQLGDSVEILTIPGPSAVTAAASISGCPMDKFIFLGYPPAKRKRTKFFQEVIDSKYPVVFYESTHRILKTLKELSSLHKECKELSSLNSLKIVVCRELTKKFETTYRGTPEQVIDKLKKDTTKGEFVVIVNPIK